MNSAKILVARLDDNPYTEAIVGLALDRETELEIANQVESNRVQCWTETQPIYGDGDTPKAGDSLFLVISDEFGQDAPDRIWGGPTIEKVFDNLSGAEEFAQEYADSYQGEVGVDIHVWRLPIGWRRDISL
ncbi:hypothetical protein SAMN04488550_0139 [Gordonia malaquae]|uniref:Uncharacterized protein n=2 Tax=Gordonia TaxID=2053 RepID=M3TJ41_GORML|nr:hypothetical protein GM1_037_00020 [Gordonia malaquae NBRC 108250]GEE00594.1 hypothetical protein nbrc107696_10400 [Gordonia spumicola]SEB48847.1 hypothetical protein SAMN04488550_0139 [Gordonia malaquae]